MLSENEMGIMPFMTFVYNNVTIKEYYPIPIDKVPVFVGLG